MTESIVATLHPARVKLDLKGRKGAEVLRELVDAVALTGALPDRERVYQELLEREKLASTGIGDGIAIPHGFSDALSQTIMAFGRCNRGARFNAVDNRPVKLFFLMLGPQGSHAEHLRLLSKLSRYLHDRNFRRGLLEARDAEEVMRLFAEKERGA